MRQIVLDTETTGIDPAAGHRVIEIGAAEIVNRRLTGNTWHSYLNPDRDIDAGAVAIHGIRREDLEDKPRFNEVADDLLTFLAGAELIIHNAPFDVAFLDHELERMRHARPALNEHCTVLDTLVMAREMHPGQRNSLDALCRRYNVDNSGRDLHGALLDANLLAHVYLAMTGGQAALSLDVVGASVTGTAGTGEAAPRKRRSGNFAAVGVSEAELAAHDALIERIRSRGGTPVAWPAED